MSRILLARAFRRSRQPSSLFSSEVYTASDGALLTSAAVEISSECKKRSHADLMHNNRSASRRFGKPPQCYLNNVEVCSCNGVCNRRGLLSCDSKAFEHFTMECCVEQLFRLPNQNSGFFEEHGVDM